MIKLLIVISIGIAGTVSVDYYASRYDHIDVEAILNNRRMVNYYAACLVSKGVCPPQGVELKRILPEALQTNCQRCTEKQKTVAFRSIKRLKKEYPKIWGELSAIWDPDGGYIRRFEATFQQPPTPDPIADRFGDSVESESVNSVLQTEQAAPTTARSTSAPPSRATAAPTTPAPPPTTRPARPPAPPATTKAPAVLTNPPKVRTPLAAVGANIEATVAFVRTIKDAVLTLYRHKLDILSRLISGGHPYKHY